MAEKYIVHEIFESIQGEGGNMGLGMLFIRFAGCNLRCPFCDSVEAARHVGYLNKAYGSWTLAGLMDRIKVSRARWVCLTGGEPCMQIDEDLIDAIDCSGRAIAVETNGTIFQQAFSRLDYVTISPKNHVVDPRWFTDGHVNEMRFLITQDGTFAGEPPEAFSHRVERVYMSPEFTGGYKPNEKALKVAMQLVTANPNYRLSVQIHKWLNIR
jgi:organic radical activating enzyme